MCANANTKTKTNSEQVGQRRQRKRSTSNIELTFTMNSPSNDCARQWTRLLRHARAFYFGLFPPLVFFSSTSNCVFIWTGEREKKSKVDAKWMCCSTGSTLPSSDRVREEGEKGDEEEEKEIFWPTPSEWEEEEEEEGREREKESRHLHWWRRNEVFQIITVLFVQLAPNDDDDISSWCMQTHDSASDYLSKRNATCERQSNSQLAVLQSERTNRCWATERERDKSFLVENFISCLMKPKVIKCLSSSQTFDCSPWFAIVCINKVRWLKQIWFSVRGRESWRPWWIFGNTRLAQFKQGHMRESLFASQRQRKVIYEFLFRVNSSQL